MFFYKDRREETKNYVKGAQKRKNDWKKNMEFSTYWTD